MNLNIYLFILMKYLLLIMINNFQKYNDPLSYNQQKSIYIITLNLKYYQYLNLIIF